jgi:hypothetical protein
MAPAGLSAWISCHRAPDVGRKSAQGVDLLGLTGRGSLSADDVNHRELTLYPRRDACRPAQKNIGPGGGGNRDHDSFRGLP